jgi:hypothetical protein
MNENLNPRYAIKRNHGSISLTNVMKNVNEDDVAMDVSREKDKVTPSY